MLRADEAADLEFREATKRYPGAARPALDGLTLTVAAGEVCVLVGPSGCGKTTALRLVNRMVELTAGEVRVGGAPVHEREPHELRRHIGYVIQQVGLFPHRTVAQNVATVPDLLGWDPGRTSARVTELLELIGLDAEYGARYPAQLSGGQRQRVGVARALAADPPVLLMDEPFGAIDPIGRDRLQAEFLRLQQQLRKTVLFVTHDIDEAIRVGDRVAVLREGGELVQHATPEELLARPADAFVEDFVGADRALKRLGLRRVGDLELLPAGAAPDGRVTLSPEDRLRDALSALLAGGLTAAPVVDGEGRTLGSLSMEQLSRALAA